MIVLKNYFVSTTKEVDWIPILHDIRFAIREAQIPEGLVTITIPGGEAFLVLANEKDKRDLKERGVPALSLPFKNSELMLEAKRMIYLVDQGASGKRREFLVQILGEAPQAPRGQQRRTRG